MVERRGFIQVRQEGNLYTPEFPARSASHELVAIKRQGSAMRTLAIAGAILFIMTWGGYETFRHLAISRNPRRLRK